jgi:hypothetical protein
MPMLVNLLNAIKPLAIRMTVVFTCLVLVPHTFAQATRNTVLFGNDAVLEDLQLSDSQMDSVDELLMKMHQELSQVRQGNEQAAERIRANYGSQFMNLLDKKQQNRFWQIGAQSSGARVFMNNRAQRVLQLTKEQQQSMEKLSDEMIQDVQAIAINVDLTLDEVKSKSDQRVKDFEKACDEILTPEQRESLQRLLGEPFDLNKLGIESAKSSRGLRSLTFVSQLGYELDHVLALDPRMQKKWDIAPETLKRITDLVRQSDPELSKVRLRVLKSTDKDFQDLPADEQQKLVMAIRKESMLIHRQTRNQVYALLNDQQKKWIRARLCQVAGLRILEAPDLAKEIELTDEQRAQFAPLISDYWNQMAPLLVVRSQKEFQADRVEELGKSLNQALRAGLTEKQWAKFLEWQQE